MRKIALEEVYIFYEINKGGSMTALGDQSKNRFFVQYRITADDEAQAACFAKDIALEQTVKLPETSLPDGSLRDV